MNLFFSYFGGKVGLANNYPAPNADDIVIEPFAGAAGYSTYHEVKKVYLFDLFPTIVETWQFLIDAANDEAVRQQLCDLPVGPFYRWDNPIPTDIPLGAQYLIGFWETQSQAYPSRWQQSPRVYENGKPRPKNRGGLWNQRTKERIIEQLPKIKDWKVYHGSYADSVGILEAEGLDLSNVVWHIDPPYQNGGKRYKKSSNDIDFDALGNWVKSLPGRVMVCERDPANWLDFDHLMTAKNASNKEYRELVWTKGFES
jgi:hypothetical protein